jgi:hypothetical protein
MVYFREIRKTKHYIEEHSQDVPWDRVVEIIFATKNPRKKGATYEIEKGEYYVVFKIEKGVLFVINAKRRR